MPGGLELILGAKAEEGLGHAVMFGLGGIFVEVMKDVVFNLTPVTTAEAEAMLAEIKAAPLLEGVRGRKGIDRQAAAEVICRLSQLLTDLPDDRRNGPEPDPRLRRRRVGGGCPNQHLTPWRSVLTGPVPVRCLPDTEQRGCQWPAG